MKRSIPKTTMVISGERVRQARELKAMTQGHLADLVGVSQAAVAQIESGKFVASDELVFAIAKHTQHPLTFFTQEPGPDFPLGSLLFRSHTAMPKKEMVSTSRYAQEAYELALRLRARTRAIPIKIPKLNGVEPKRAAKEMRVHVGLAATDPAPHLLNLLEWSGTLIISISNVKSRDAFSLWFEETPIIAIARDRPGDRGRLSVAHEVGHLVLHAGRSRLEVDDTQADDFAAEFLMPELAIRKDLKGPITLSLLASLKPKWKVSMQAMIVRAKGLSIVTERQYRYLFEQLSSMGWRTKEPVEIEPEKPRLLRQMAEALYGVPIDIDQLSREANLDSVMVRELLSGYDGKRENVPSANGKVITLSRGRSKPTG